MDTFSVIMFVIIMAIAGVFFFGMWLFLKRLDNIQNTSSDDKSQLMLQQQIQELTRTLDKKLGDTSKQVQTQHIEVAKIMRDTTESLTKLDATNKQVLDFSDQLRDLQDILKNPKQRGNLGEYQLETLLSNVFPPTMYKMQYAFKDGMIVDAAIFIKDKIIPIDSKFSLENYNNIKEATDKAERDRLEKHFKQDLKNRIDETAKYVRPDEGTLDFAFMFIPAEGIFADLLINKVGVVKANTRDLIDYAFIEKKVHIVSPTTLLSHLKMVLQGLRAMQIEDSAKEIKANVEKLGKHLQAYQEYMVKLGTQLGTTVNTYNTASNEFKKVDKDVLKVTGEDRELLDSGRVEKPKG